MLLIFTVESWCVSFIIILLRMRLGYKGADFGDRKRIIAYSTSSQLVLVRVIAMLSGVEAGAMYVFVHAFFKSLMFMIVGWQIHGSNSQSSSNDNNSYILIPTLLALLTMCGLIYFNVAIVKDQIITGSNGQNFLELIFVFYALTTVFYSTYLSTVRENGGVKMVVGGIYCVGSLALRVHCMLRGATSSGSVYGVSLTLIIRIFVLTRVLRLTSSEFYQKVSVSKLSVASWGSPNLHKLHLHRWLK